MSSVLDTDRDDKPQSRQSAKLFLQSSELGLPQPLRGGGAHSLAREGPNSDEGTYTVVLFMCV